MSDQPTEPIPMPAPDPDAQAYSGEPTSSPEPSHAGIRTVLHMDLTVEDAPRIRDFYTQVLGWQAAGLDMGGYEDYMLMTPEGALVGGVCHARGMNAVLPPVWIAYVGVPDLGASIAAAELGGGKVISGPHGQDGHYYAIIQDPAGAVLGLMQAPAGETAEG